MFVLRCIDVNFMEAVAEGVQEKEMFLQIAVLKVAKSQQCYFNCKFQNTYFL